MPGDPHFVCVCVCARSATVYHWIGPIEKTSIAKKRLRMKNNLDQRDFFPFHSLYFFWFSAELSRSDKK